MSNSEQRKRYKRSPKGKAAEARYKQKQLPRQRDYYRTVYGTARGRAMALCKSAKKRAKQLGVAFDLQPSRIEALITAGRCELTGIAFDLSVTEKHASPWAPSLDRKDPKGPYSHENVRLTCWAVNRALNDWGLPVLLQLAEALTQHQNARS